MFTYMHCYMNETWDGLVERGFIDENSGIRFTQGIRFKEEEKFNVLAKKDGKLYNLVKENNMPFYIDRLQGGTFIQDYKYDMELVNEYRKMLGDKFWGFQMHEWMNNICSDINRIKRTGCPFIEGTRKWREEDIKSYILKEYPYKYIYLESMNAKEYAEFGCPENAEEYLPKVVELFKKRQEYTNGDLLPCDSCNVAYPIELKNGAKRIMAEIGAGTPDTRPQIAYTRGMAKAYNVPFGTYYEPWNSVDIEGKRVFTACNYHRQKLNEWKINQDGPYNTYGENGGSSRSMQMRLHLYSYMAGASFISEEWGMCNTFYDWNDFDITPYGKVKLDFINFTRKYNNIGKTCAPIAVVIPKELQVYEGVRTEEYDMFCGFETSENLKRLSKISRPILQKLFMETEEMIGSETIFMVNSRIPDAIDIVNEDNFDSSEYEYLVDATGNSEFAKKYASKICKLEDVEMLLDRLLPCIVEGGLHHIVNKTEDGVYYLMVFNNNGVVRSLENGEKTLKEADKTVVVECKDNRNLIMLEGNSACEYGDGKYYVTVPAGGWFFGKF